MILTVVDEERKDCSRRTEMQEEEPVLSDQALILYRLSERAGQLTYLEGLSLAAKLHP